MGNNIYDEKIYLHNDEIIKLFKSDSDSRKRIVQEEEEIYKSIIENYDELIYELACLLRKLGYNGSLDTSILLSHLINSGYLSDNMIFAKKEKEEEITSRLGISIINGYGVCRNFAAMHKAVFGQLSLYDKKIYCYDGIGSGKRKPANHVINLIHYDRNYYGIDIYNGNRLYKFTSELELKEISLVFINHLRYKPYYEIITGESEECDIHNNLCLFKYCTLKDYINAFTYDELECEIKKRIQGDEKAYEEFHNKNKTLIKSIKKGL